MARTERGCQFSIKFAALLTLIAATIVWPCSHTILEFNLLILSGCFSCKIFADLIDQNPPSVQVATQNLGVPVFIFRFHLSAYSFGWLK